MSSRNLLGLIEGLANEPEINKDKHGKPLVSLANLSLVLLKDEEWFFSPPGSVVGRRHRIAYDTLRDEVVMLAAPPWPLEIQDPLNPPTAGAWADTDTQMLRYWFERKHGVTVGTPLCESILQVVAKRQHYDPLRSYIKGTVWDGVPRLGRWVVTYLGAADTAYHCAAGLRWSISLVARPLRPGCQADLVLVLEGGQGIGKSSALRVLGGDFYTDQVSALGTKDSSADLRGAHLIEFSEGANFTKSEIEQVKAYTTRPVDRYRPAYGRRVREYPRTCVFAMTTNSHAYLRDATGARRFVPIKCGRIDLEALRRDRDQLFAEARVLFERGEKWHFTEAENALAKDEQEERAEVDPWQTFTEGYLVGKTRVGLDDILLSIGIERPDQDTRRRNRVVDILTRLGWTRTRLRVEGGRQYFYVPPPVVPVPTPKTEGGTERGQLEALLPEDKIPTVPTVPPVPSSKTEITEQRVEQAGLGLSTPPLSHRNGGGQGGTVGTRDSGDTTPDPAKAFNGARSCGSPPEATPPWDAE